MPVSKTVKKQIYIHIYCIEYKSMSTILEDEHEPKNMP